MFSPSRKIPVWPIGVGHAGSPEHEMFFCKKCASDKFLDFTMNALFSIFNLPIFFHHLMKFKTDSLQVAQSRSDCHGVRAPGLLVTIVIPIVLVNIGAVTCNVIHVSNVFSILHSVNTHAMCWIQIDFFRYHTCYLISRTWFCSCITRTGESL